MMMMMTMTAKRKERALGFFHSVDPFMLQISHAPWRTKIYDGKWVMRFLFGLI